MKKLRKEKMPRKKDVCYHSAARLWTGAGGRPEYRKVMKAWAFSTMPSGMKRYTKKCIKDILGAKCPEAVDALRVGVVECLQHKAGWNLADAETVRAKAKELMKDVVAKRK